MSSICLLKKCEPGPRLEVGRSPRLAHEHNRQSLFEFPDIPLPRCECERPNEAPRGLGGGNPGAQIGPIRSTVPGGGGSARWEPPAASRAPSFSAARHRPLCPRLRRGVLTARTSFSGACGLGRLRRCMPMRSAAFLTGCTISTPPATRSQDAKRFWFDTRANLRREMEDRKRRFDNKTEVRGKIADVLKKTAFKLCRMLLPGGETKQIEPYHTTAKAV